MGIDERISVSNWPVIDIEVKDLNAATTPSNVPDFASARKSDRLVDLTMIGSATSFKASHSALALVEMSGTEFGKRILEFTV